ncbi:MAG: trypsin-like serine protease [Chloroflexota bacterium]
MRRLLVSLMVAGSLLAVSLAPAAAITKTYVKDDVHTFVGLIGFYDTAGDWSHRCTGELLSPTVVLTAGHCTDNEAGGVMASARIWFQQDAGVNYDLVTQRDAVTGYPDSCTGTGGDQLGKLCATSTRMFNYGFDNFAGFPNTHDVGIVILDQPINGLGFATLAAPKTLDALLKARGTQDATFGVSGYGISFSAKQGAVSISYRERLMAESKLVNLVSRQNDGYNIQLNGNGDDRGGTCSGDSGGPVFYPSNSNQVVAVTSWGMSNAGCRGDGWYYRTDRQEVIDWINGVAGTHF